MRTPRLGSAPAPLFALFSLVSLVAACSTADSDSSSIDAPPLNAVVRTVDDGVLLCGLDGARCAAAEAGQNLPHASRIETPTRARATLEFEGGASLELAPQSSVVVDADGSTLRVARGGAVVTTTTSQEPFVPLALLDREIELDPLFPASLAILATSSDRASLTLHNGKATIRRDGGEAIELRSGDTLRLVLGQPTTPRDVASSTATPVGVHELVGDDSGVREPSNAVRETPRGLGSMTARVPGTNDIVGGIRLATHHVRVTLKDGFARTEVEEEMANDTPRVLEGRYVFPLPPRATIARLGLWVGNELVEGEMVERTLAARIFKGIVDDTVRPRDPALLEWVRGGEASLKIFPMPAKGSRKVILAYGEALPASGDRVRYVYPLPSDNARGTRIDTFSITVVAEDSGGVLDITTPSYAATVGTDADYATAAFSAENFVPSGDFVLTYRREPEAAARLTTFVPTGNDLAQEKGDEDSGNEAHPGYAALRFRADLPENTAVLAHRRIDRVLVLDASHSQSRDTWNAQRALARGLVARLDPDERFVVVACDTACDSYPDDGFAKVDGPTLAGLDSYLAEHDLGGGTDLSGALISAAARLDGADGGQIVYLGDGAATAGELVVDSIASRARPSLAAHHADLRLLGAGRVLDENRLAGLAQALGGTFEPVAGAGSLAGRIEELALALRRPVLTDARVETCRELRDITPRTLPNLRLGEEVTVYARLDPTADPGAIRLTAKLSGQPYVLERAVEPAQKGLASTPMVARLWAEGRMAELDAERGDNAKTALVALSKRFHVMSRHTALLVLENDRMFSEFGIERRTKKSDALTTNDLDGPMAQAAAQPSQAFGAPSNDPMQARGNLWGDDVGDSFGQGGLGLSGIGEGGGGRGEGTIGLGNIGNIGRGEGTSGTGVGFGAGHGRLGGSHKSSSPKVRMGATSVSGRLPPEIIQRIVRQNFGRFRFCYEQSLRKDPNLQGRVSVRFVIGRDGAVGSSTADGPTAELANCVSRAFYGLSFPQPEGGIVTVIYPIVFSPADGGGGAPGPTTPTPPTASSPPRTFVTWGDPEPIRGPSIVHVTLPRSFINDNRSTLDKLAVALEADPASRPKHIALLKALFVRGHFAEALDQASQFADADPDLPAARELLAFAFAANGQGDEAARAMGSLVETTPESVTAQLRAAKAYEAVGDDMRACAHYRAATALRPSDDTARREAFRCRARTGEDRATILAEAQALAPTGPVINALIAELEAGRVPETALPGKASTMEARVICDAGVERCPAVMVIAPTGNVACPWAPTSARSERGAVSLSAGMNGNYRTFLVGGDPGATGKVEVTAHGVKKSFPFSNAGSFVPIAETRISELW